ncbi:hypothetical protein [Nocardia sp. XZ_19_385]|uniref:hypothetical protein n=1 Tax=Nocardia sp. XZ_19_385 TaxID=2769488 RepID=UPI00188FADF9|nr:hypothetical protein [Nocardia sp. XZ_19_385]
MSESIGPLVPTDEGFHHQIVDTFATVASSDLSWTEKVCAMAAARDGSLQLGFGLGKYVNRNVMDGYAGISRGVEQVTVRANRELLPEPERTVIGPVRYEVLEPLKKIRFVLEPNDIQPIAFDWTFTAELPAQLEDRTHMRAGYRVSANLVRYHQIGVASGWVDIDGRRTEITPEDWVSTRDHSWGVRYDVGRPRPDVQAMELPPEVSFRMIWCPALLERADGSRYGIHLHYQIIEATGFSSKTVMGGLQYSDGRVLRWRDLTPELRFDPDNRRLLGGRIHATDVDGTARTLDIEVVSDTGFHLGAGLYHGYKDRFHGEWLGPGSHLDGERIADCSTPANARQLHQIRDTVVRITDPVGGGVGYGNCQPIITGADAALGLSMDSSFM